MGDVTRILEVIDAGGADATEDLLPLVYDELRQLATRKLAREKPGQTLQATALVHDVYIRLAGAKKTQQWNGRGHFFAAAAEAMRRILVDKARRKHRQKRGEGHRPVPIDGLEMAAPGDEDKMLLVHEALDRLAAHDPQKAELVKLRYFVGLNHQEIAEVLGVSEKTVMRHWIYAKAWLLDTIQQQIRT